jgi:hypothetical protein
MKNELPINHRPIKGLKDLLQSNIVKLSKSEFRFLKLMKELDSPISDEKIINYYKSNVQRHYGKFELIKGKWIEVQYTNSEIRIKALVWFDRNLGCMIRKQILSDKGRNVLDELMLP